MRLVLVDPSKADIEAIEELPGAKGTFTQSGQFQVIKCPYANAVGSQRKRRVLLRCPLDWSWEKLVGASMWNRR